MKRKKDRGRETNIENKMHQQLPEELIVEILLRLPVKSLLRFKCVCKSWLSLISDHHFATSHFHLTIAAHTNRLVLISNCANETQFIDFEASLDDDAASASLDLHFMLSKFFPSLEIGGSCRGFLFLRCYENKDFYLWNPSTGIHKQIPCSPIASNVDTRFFIYLYGFGYEPSTDDYLVVLGSNYTIKTNVVTHFEFFSLRTNTWKEIEGVYWPCLNRSYNPRNGTLSNGAIHWLACRANFSVIIVVFDLTEKRILEMPLPDDDFYYDPIDCDLWVCGGFMSLWAMDFWNNVVEIWVMKEYGVSSSWTMTLVLSIDETPIDETQYFSPICSTNCGDIVGSDGSVGLVKYNDNGQQIEHRSYWHNPYGSQAAVYTESLLPLPVPRDTQPA